MLELSDLGDISRFRDEDFKNEVFLTTADDSVKIKCNGLLLAARSAPIEELFRTTDKLPVDEFKEDQAGLNTCMRLLYGGTEQINEKNCRTVYRFGQVHEIEEMCEGVLKWVEETMPAERACHVYVELAKVTANISRLSDVITRHATEHTEDFLKGALEACESLAAEDAATVAALVSTNEAITSQIDSAEAELKEKYQETLKKITNFSA